jgi:DNA-binding MarR family transcriptional regulator
MISDEQFAIQSAFRSALTQFQRFSERAAARAGLTHPQYLLLLHLRGFADREWATIRELADRLLASHQATVALVKRCQARGLVKKRKHEVDRRCVEIHLTPAARKLVTRVATQNRGELARLRDIFHSMEESVKTLGLSRATRSGKA